MAHRFAGIATAAVLQLAALVLAHELVFLARYGSRFGEALVHSGHGAAWTGAVIASVALATGVAALAVARLCLLGTRIRATAGTFGSFHPPTLEPRALLQAWLRLAPRMAILSVVLLTIQENVEHAAAGRVVPGAGILLSPEYPGGAWITIAVALLISFVAALFAWRHRVLLARLRAAGARRPRARTSLRARPRGHVARPAASLLGRGLALRAPPASIAA